MKTQNELIEYYTKNLEKVISSYGVNSDYTNNAFYLLQAVKMNMPLNNIFYYATKKCNDLHKEALQLLN